MIAEWGYYYKGGRYGYRILYGVCEYTNEGAGRTEPETDSGETESGKRGVSGDVSDCGSAGTGCEVVFQKREQGKKININFK